jgi:transcriptional regulator with PAS, ATPase and Fis domain
MSLAAPNVEDFHASSSSARGAVAQFPAPVRPFHDMVGQSAAMREIFRLAQRVAKSPSTVIITGETGTGKGMVARAIHDASPRTKKPFVAINCGAIPENLLESELFGHTQGAFTGATSAKTGKVEMADGGTLFLDEIGDMSPDLQVKLLKVLEEKEFERVGGTKKIKVDVRVVAATHRDLEQEVAAGRFREDLFYRLWVIPIHLAPLRERKSDIPALIAHFLEICNQSCGGAITGVSPEAMDALCQHEWPGNIRELKNLVERAVVLKGEGEITCGDLPSRIAPVRTAPQAPVFDLSGDGMSFEEAVTGFEKALIAESLRKAGGVKNKAAKLLQIKRTTLVEKIKRYEIAC